MKPLGKTENLHSWNSLFKNQNFLQTDSDDEMNWLTSKLHSSISWLLKLSFLQIDSNYEMNWSISIFSETLAKL